ncbi:MAG: hypothetical protein HYV27_19275 [Candidatus Hydrogenedentes bacterium]|nr:hypothetical protein [Candidatus Hydrogenedentota bacterium]
MAFATIQNLRDAFGITVQFAADSMVSAALDAAHETLLTRLAPSVDTGNPPAALVAGETHLACSVLLAHVCAAQVLQLRSLRIGGNEVNRSGGENALMSVSRALESQAWERLAPYLAEVRDRGTGGVTDTLPVLGASTT